MKTRVIYFLFFLATLSGNSQIVLEHEYNGVYYRIRLQHAGEKYYNIDNSTQTLSLYNRDHSFWKKIQLPIDTNGTYYVQEISDKILNGDSLIEISGVHISKSGSYKVIIFNELGTKLLEVQGAVNVLVSNLPGLTVKLLLSVNFSTTAVYSIPQLTIEHQFSRNAIRRLADNSEEFFVEKASDSTIKVYRADYSLYRSIKIPGVFSGPQFGIDHISRKTIKSDTLLEVVLKRLQNEAGIINENGVVLHHSYNAYNFQVSEIPGYPDKLCDYETIYSLPGIIKEHTYKSFYPFRRKFQSAPVYVMGLGDTIRFFAADHSLRTKIKVTSPPGLTLSTWYHYTDYAIDPDHKIEVAYGSTEFTWLSAHESRIVNEDGILLFGEPGGYDLSVSEIGHGAQNKLLSYVTDSAGTFLKTKVYALPAYDLTGITSNGVLGEIVIFPNPANDYFELRADKTDLRRLTILDASGKTVVDVWNISEGRIRIDHLAKGMYFVIFEELDGKKTQKKLIKL